jgi:hypothetical protein
MIEGVVGARKGGGDKKERRGGVVGGGEEYIMLKIFPRYLESIPSSTFQLIYKSKKCSLSEHLPVLSKTTKALLNYSTMKLTTTLITLPFLCAVTAQTTQTLVSVWGQCQSSFHLYRLPLLNLITF